MNYDKILVELGEFGPWQIVITLLLWLPAAVDGVMTLIASYTSLVPEAYRCNIPDCDGPGFGFSDFPKQKLFPSFNEVTPNYCQYFSPLVLANGSCSSNLSSDVLQCSSSSDFTYEKDSFVMSSTLVTEFNMFCDNDKTIWIPVFNSCFMIGLGIGSFFFGLLSDRIGRRHTLLIAILLCSGGSLAGSIVPNYWSYAILRIIVGAGSEGCYIVAFTMVLEIVGVRDRLPCLKWVSFSTFQGNMVMIPFAMGMILVSMSAMVLSNWRDLQLALSLICLATASVWMFIPESPRWLLAHGREEEAREVVRKAAKKNGVTLSDEVFNKESQNGDMIEEGLSQYGLKDIFHPSLVKITLAMFVCWPVSTLLYYGLTFSADNIHLTDNTFLSFIIVAAVEIPPSLFLILVMDIWGRKPLLVFSFLLPGISCLAAGWLEEGVLFTIFVLVGKFFATASFNIVNIYTAELYPTSIRTTMFGTCSTVARIGGVLAPWVAVYLPNQGSFGKEIPLYIFGSTSVAGGLMALLLPETLGSPLPNTFQDVEDMKVNEKSIWKCADPLSYNVSNCSI